MKTFTEWIFEDATVKRPRSSTRLPDNDQWKNRFSFPSTSRPGTEYIAAQNKKTGGWGCSCKGWTMHKDRDCKHIAALKIPGGFEPYDANVRMQRKSRSQAVASPS